MTDDIEKAAREAGEVMDKAAAYITAQANAIERLRLERAQLRRALYECAYCLNSLDVPPSAMTKTTADTLVQLNLGGFND
ncbi:MAG: hypothetical protein EB132_02425 [Actinobacteria bacterium]|nr:hypothetical protein [Actinomycetota bacterium]